MNLKLFYSPPKWKAFIAPEKPNYEYYHRNRRIWGSDAFGKAMDAYEKAYAEAKANALEVGNTEVIKPVFWEMQSGAEYTWYGTAVIEDGKYILSI